MDFLTSEIINKAAEFLQEKFPVSPKVGMILGSGLGPFADAVENSVQVMGKQVPGWPESTVEGHVGRLVCGTLEGVPVFVMQGRSHYYEGHEMTRLGLPVRVMQKLGAEYLFVTNAAGAVNPNYKAGSLMILNDHINLLGMAGVNPLRGPNLDEFGPRFPDMSRPYDKELIKFAHNAASDAGVSCHEGVYICLAGPSYETPADLRFLRMIGVDAVGMSTVPEVIVARHGGMKVLGISGISNKANLDGSTITTHEEVMEAGRVIVPKLTSILRGVLKRL
ncbi:MAG: purine-nucleoside phosphorylase [Anaerolineales bacterium]|nr:purine-nucleoside phosphorylase [Anaerolineales bacterium]